MANFFVVDQTKLVRGAGRILIAPSSQAKPTQLSDVIDLATYAAKTGWTDAGATTQGITININNTESSFDVDQVNGAIGTAPDIWSCNVTTQLAEVTVDNLIIAWDGAAKTVDSTPTIPETETGFAGATAYTERRMAIMFKDFANNIWGFFFHRAVRSPVQSSFQFQKTGNEMTIPIDLNILADATESDPVKQFFRLRVQNG